MLLPDGRDCKYFYADYYRGRNFVECRALKNQDEKQEWNVSFCEACPFPNYLRNNSCQNIVYSISIGKSFFRKRMKISAWCQKVHEPVADPNVGCGHCHEQKPLGE